MGQLGRVRIIRFECGQFVSCLREMGCYLDEARRSLLLWHILLTEDFERSLAAAEVNHSLVANSAALASATVLASVVAAI